MKSKCAYVVVYKREPDCLIIMETKCYSNSEGHGQCSRFLVEFVSCAMTSCIFCLAIGDPTAIFYIIIIILNANTDIYRDCACFEYKIFLLSFISIKIKITIFSIFLDVGLTTPLSKLCKSSIVFLSASDTSVEG